MDTLCYDIMDRLKESTRELHQRAEENPLQQMLIHGSIGRPAYAAYLAQMALVHERLETHLANLAGLPPFEKVIRPYHFRLAMIQADLDLLDAHASPAAPLNATRAFVGDIDRAAQNGAGLLGILYVLEGSTNGSKFIARSLQQSLELRPGPGTQYLDPHGENQRPRWAAFKADMSAAAFSDAETEAILESAARTFSALIEISDESLALEKNAA